MTVKHMKCNVQASPITRLHPFHVIYALDTTFLGRMCLSGDLQDLSREKWALAQRAMDFYRRVAHIIKHGTSRRFGSVLTSYRHPEGW